jgi:phosphoribosylformylglycinamidine cyclo-ligase
VPAKLNPSAYAAAGVNIDDKMSALKAIKAMVKSTRTPGVLSDIGLFGGLFKSPGRDQVLVASTDGVGTKIKVAVLAGRHDTVGQDIVNHCVNDILVQGAHPLFFMDYVGTSRIEGRQMKAIVAGICKACRENNCALLGGETAEMPGVYPPGEYDLVGTIVGTVSRRTMITGRTVRSGQLLIGLPSSGLHTNGYSLARKVIFETAGLGLKDRLPGTRKTVGELLLAVHRSYLKPVMAALKVAPLHALAHITGGGFQDNIPRVLPAGLSARIDRQAWTPPPLFQFIQTTGRVDRDEMYRVFNMGIGMVLIVSAGDAPRILAALSKSRLPGRIIGDIVRGRPPVQFAN